MTTLPKLKRAVIAAGEDLALRQRQLQKAEDKLEARRIRKRLGIRHRKPCLVWDTGGGVCTCDFEEQKRKNGL